MQIRIIKTGQVLHVPRDQSYEVLRQAGLIEILSEAAPKKFEAKLTWTVQRDLHTGVPFVRISCSCGNETAIIPNPSEKARWGHCGVSEIIPAETLAAFRRASSKPEETDEMAERRGIVQASRAAAAGRFIE